MKTSLNSDKTRKSKSVANNLPSGILQTKLKVGKPDDKYEHEAEQTANRVMMMPETNIVSKKCGSCTEDENVQTKALLGSVLNPIQRIEKEEEHIQPKIKIQRQDEKEEEDIQSKLTIQRQPEEEEENIQPKLFIQRQAEKEEEQIRTKLFLQKKNDNKKIDFQRKRKTANASLHALSNSFETTLNSQRRNGIPLSDSTKNFMESRIGADFSGVRVHSDSTAASLSNKINAQAFTTGTDIFFNSGKYNPESSSGKHLLAHELTHVVQQGGTAQRSKKNLQKSVSSGNSFIQRGILGDIVSGVSTIVSNVSHTIGVGISTASNWINHISNFIGGGISYAWSWINRVASVIGMSILASWNWIQNLASQVGMGIRNAFQWIIGISQSVGKSVWAAWAWLRQLANMLRMGILAAWSWIFSKAIELNMGIVQAFIWLVNVSIQIAPGSIIDAWNWLKNLAVIVRGSIQYAWKWIRNIVFTLRMGFVQALAYLINITILIGVVLITRAWEWIQNVAIRIGLSVLQAWQWIQNVARRISRTVISAWNYLKRLAIKFRASIRQVWIWLQSLLPVIQIGNFKNSGSTSSNNLCTLCPQTLGPSSTDGTNGMELRADIIGHNPLFTYDFKRIKERATWKKVGTTWTQLTYVGPGANDDSHDQDEDLIPDGNKIFVIDTPGFTNKNNPVGDNTASEAVYKASFVETAKTLKLGGTWKTVSNSFNWHSVSWFEKHAGSWRRKANSNEIDTGSVTVGTGDP